MSDSLREYRLGLISEEELFSELQNVYKDDTEQYIQSLLTKSEYDEDFFNSLKSSYPEVFSVAQDFLNKLDDLSEQSTNKYINDIATQEDAANNFCALLLREFPDLYSQLSSVYDGDKENFINHIFAENETNEEFLNFLAESYPELFDSLGTTYGNDVENWTSMEQAKADITSNLIKELNEMWTAYFKGLSETFSAYGTILENADGSGYTFMGSQDDSDAYDHNMSEEEWQASQSAINAYNKVKEGITDAISLANTAVANLESAAYDKISSGIDLSWENLSKTKDSDSSNSSDSSSDSHFEQMVQQITLGQALGKSSLNKLKF
jgi:hypothetical protein